MVELDALLSSNEHMLSDTRSAELHDTLKNELKPYSSGNVNLQGEPTLLAPNLARALRLVFHELATNAAKYGALSSPNGSLDISWITVAGQLRIRWIEQGGPLVTLPTRRGFGTLILSRVLNDFGGRVATDYRSEGVSCEIFCDFDNVAGPIAAGTISTAHVG